MDPKQARGLILSGKAPRAMIVNGNLDLDGCTGLTRLPESLTVGNSLDLNGCTNLKRLPESLSVIGWLDLQGCTNLTHLPESLTVTECLDLRGCTSLRNLAGDIKWSIFCDPEFVDQIDWPLYISYIPHLEPEIQALIENKLKRA